MTFVVREVCLFAWIYKHGMSLNELDFHNLNSQGFPLKTIKFPSLFSSNVTQYV